jgi:protein-disulfide isomerase
MLCIIAFVVLGILGIFSATNRALAKEAMDCVLRRVTLRPCNTGFDEKMKAKILGSIITRSEVAARVINKNFELLSWVFFILMLGSTVWAVRGVYLYYVTGSCNGLNQAAFCVFDPKGESNQVSTVPGGCKIKPTTEKDLTLQGVNLAGFPAINTEAKDKIVFVGCYTCDYTRKAYPMIRDLVKRYNTSFTFLHYPVKEKTDYMSRLGYCVYQQDQEKYWKLNDLLFATDKSNLDNDAFIQKTLGDLGLDAAKINVCTEDQKTKDTIKMQMDEIVKTKFYGTPTIFINDRVLVGPKPYRVYAIMLKGLFYWRR